MNTPEIENQIKMQIWVLETSVNPERQILILSIEGIIYLYGKGGKKGHFLGQGLEVGLEVYFCR